MNLGYSHLPHNTICHNPLDKDYANLTEGGSVSKKRKTSTSIRGKAKANARLIRTDSVTTEGTSVTGEVSILTLRFVHLIGFPLPCQQSHHFPDWPSVDGAGASNVRGTVLNPSGDSFAAGPSGHGTFASASLPTDFSFTPVLKFFTESMNHLVSTMESNQQTVQRAMQEQQQQFSSHLSLLHTKLTQSASASPGPSSPSGSNDAEEDGADDILPSPKKRKQTKRHVLKNAGIGGGADMATYNEFLVCF